MQNIQKDAGTPASSRLRVEIGADAEERLRLVAEHVVLVQKCLTQPYDRKLAYSTMRFAFENELDLLRLSYVADWNELSRGLEADTKSAKENLRRQRNAAIDEVSALFQHETDADALSDPWFGGHPPVDYGDDLLPQEIVQELRRADELLVESRRHLEGSRAEAKRFHDEMYRAQVLVQDAVLEVNARTFRKSFRRTRNVFLWLRASYWLVKGVILIPYLVAIAIAFLLPKPPQLSTHTSASVVVLSVALAAVIKRYISAKVSSIVDRRIDALIRFGATTMTTKLVLLEVNLAACEGLRRFNRDRAARGAKS